MKYYVVGFVFNRRMSKVLLINKLKPEWQAGRLNGVGGKVEPGEAYSTAMAREFEEETGMIVPEHRWRNFCTLRACDGVVQMFTVDADFNSKIIIPQMTPEPVSWESYAPLSDRVIDNLRWLIPMALGTPVRAEVNERSTLCQCQTHPNCHPKP